MLLHWVWWHFLIGIGWRDESAVWDWISNVAVMVGLVLLVAGVYAGLGLAAGTTGGAGDADGDGAGRGGDGNPPTLVGE